MQHMLDVYNQVNEYGKANGMDLEMVEPGHIICTMKILPEHQSAPGIAHGGIIAGMMDSLLGAGALSLAFTQHRLVSTVEFKINYYHGVKLHDELRGESKIEFHGKRLISVSADIVCQKRDLKVAKGLGTFNSYPVENFTSKNVFPDAS